MPEITLSNGAVALVDPDVHVWASRVTWYAHHSDTKTYARIITSVQGFPVRMFLHRAVMGLGPDDRRQVDHVNGNTLDNRRANLRIVTNAQNAQNQGSRGGASRFRGVTFDKSRGKWMASAQLNGRKTTIGRFDTEEEAARAASAWRADNMPYSREEKAA